LLFLELAEAEAEESFTLIPDSGLGSYENVMKDFAEKQTAYHVRLISGQGF
jgi:hypothetical protein